MLAPQTCVLAGVIGYMWHMGRTQQTVPSDRAPVSTCCLQPVGLRCRLPAAEMGCVLLLLHAGYLRGVLGTVMSECQVAKGCALQSGPETIARVLCCHRRSEAGV